MFRIVPLLLLLNGCMIFSTGIPSHVGEVPERMKKTERHAPPVYDRNPYGIIADLEIGQWATYQDEGRTVTLAVAARDGEDLWIEVIEEGDPRQVSARRVTPDGRVIRAYFRALPDGVIQEQTLAQTPVTEARDMEEVRRRVKDVKLGERAAKHLKITFEDLDGRRRHEESWWSKDVPPLYDGTEFGGLIRRGKTELVKHGTGHQRLLVPPR